MYFSTPYKYTLHRHIHAGIDKYDRESSTNSCSPPPIPAANSESVTEPAFSVVGYTLTDTYCGIFCGTLMDSSRS